MALEDFFKSLFSFLCNYTSNISVGKEEKMVKGHGQGIHKRRMISGQIKK